MTLQDFRELYDAQPFRAFTVHLANGRHIEVVHPDFVAVPPRGRTVVVFTPNGRMNIIDLLLVSDLEADVPPGEDEDLPPTAPSTNLGER